MRKWERRLKDLSMILDSCGINYLEPDLFRFNTNHFLTTARTVSFLFQKDKSSIPNFDLWHANNIAGPWGGDQIMRWSISSRNSIEKEGDLDLHSQFHARLIFSYLEERDINLEIEKSEYFGVGVKRLMRFARKQLPSGLSDVSVIKIERRWVANTLPEHELLQALLYIYARMHSACVSLAKHLGEKLDNSIPDPIVFDEVHTASRRIKYFKLNDQVLGTLVAKREKRDPNFQPPEWLKMIREKNSAHPPKTLLENVKQFANVAESNFDQFGNHMSMLWLFNEKFQPIDFIITLPNDQASKYIFWRAMADRIHYLKAKSIIFTSEAWIRSGADKGMNSIMRNLTITGEILQVVGVDCDGQSEFVTWNIKRLQGSEKPTLESPEDSIASSPKELFFLIPASRALQKNK